MSEDHLTTQQRRLLIDLAGLEDQIQKGHFLNAHFRAFEIAHDAWKEHIRQNADVAPQTQGWEDPAGSASYQGIFVRSGRCGGMCAKTGCDNPCTRQIGHGGSCSCGPGARLDNHKA